MLDSADSYQKRLRLFDRLSSLAPAQLDQVILALALPQGLIPPVSAQLSDRVAALLAWAESETGGGLERVEQVLAEVLAGKTDAPYLELAGGTQRHMEIADSVVRSNVIAGDRNFIENNYTYNYYGLPETRPEATRSDANEKTLIEAVWTEVDDRLRQSLHNAILIRLEMAEQRKQVSRPWDSQLRTAEQGTKSLEPGTHIAEVFDRRDVGGKLLILGNPGAGKTTTMLDLAAVLIQRANDQPDHPIPVMFNLSSWQQVNQSITDWLLGELKLKYGVSPKLGQTWLSEKKLLPLLDGLDELPPERQEPVVRLINEWLRSGEGPHRLLVCSRLEEYELYASRLALNGAICLEPLTDEQLVSYLDSLGMGSLWATLQQDAELLDLVRTPLLLSVSILANEGIDPQQWQQKQTTPERVSYLLDAYVERRLHEPVQSKAYPPGKQPTAQQTRHWLVWLAKQLREQSEDEFLIEKLQPTMLANRREQSLYGLIVGLIFGLIIGLIVGPIGGLIVGPIGGLYGLIFGLIAGLIFGLIIGLISGRDSIDTVESFDLPSSRLARMKFFLDLQDGLIIGLIIGLIAWPIFGLIAWPIFGLIIGLIFGLIAGLIAGLIIGLITALKTDVAVRGRPNQGIIQSAKNILPVSLVSYPAGVALALGGQFASFVADSGLNFGSLELDFPRALIEGIAFALIFGGFNAGLTTCIQHFSLRVALYRAHAIPWNYARFLNYCTDRLLLQRVGGRYRFIHKLVQEHFAQM